MGRWDLCESGSGQGEGGVIGGDWSEEQGKRNDINCFKDAINEGMSVKDLWINHFALMLRYRDMVIKMRNDINDSYYEGLRSVYLIFGESGTSKSKMIRDEEVNIYDKALDSKDKDWWEGYNQQQVVHFEDFEGEIPMRECIRLCDRYKIGVAKRYIGTVPFDGRIIYFSSNKIPEEWFNKESKETNANIVQFREQVSSEFQRQESQANKLAEILQSNNTNSGNQAADCGRNQADEKSNNNWERKGDVGIKSKGNKCC